MMSEKTVSNKFAFEFLDNPRNSLIFVGYADPDSPAGKIRAAKRGDPIQLDPDRAPIDLQCEVHEFDFSGHAIREDLRKYANDVSPKKIACHYFTGRVWHPKPKKSWQQSSGLTSDCQPEIS